MYGIADLEREINKREGELFKLESKRETLIEEINNMKSELRNMKFNDDIKIGSILKFKDSEEYEIATRVVGDGRRYNLILLSDYSHEWSNMTPYYIFDYNTIHVETLIKKIEVDYCMQFIGVEE